MAIPHPAVTRPHRQAFESALLYGVLCATYIVLSGSLAVRAAVTAEHVHAIETLKGLAFILVTGLIFYGITRLRLTRIRQQEETIIAQEQALQQADRKRWAAMTAATVAHDLNNLLLSFSGLLDELDEFQRDVPSLREMHVKIESGISKLSHLAKRLASTLGRAVPERDEAVDLRAAVSELLTLAQKHPDIRHCQLVASDVASVTLLLNRTLFEEAVLNLLVNGAQAAGPTGRLEVRLTTDGSTAMLAVHDSGPGVPEDLLEDIFDPSFSTKPDGTGIGLLTVTAFAASCGATIVVDRSPLGGAMFQLRIPVRAPGVRIEQGHPAEAVTQ
ncbi:MAG: HAMP domain-containing histidine kinase [Lentisphaerae bacterium]|nr:HAMP domain-containing histidine kinase [Lentisphaerota bacterium]